MILNDSHMKMIADKGRLLPDSVLAPLVISVILGMTDEARPAAETAKAPPAKARIGTLERYDRYGHADIRVDGGGCFVVPVDQIERAPAECPHCGASQVAR